MSRKTAFVLTLVMSVIAAIALILRLVRGTGEDWFELVGPAAILLLMLVVMSQNRPGRGDGGEHV